MTTLNCKQGSSCPHVPTELTRALVLNLNALGIKNDDIARRLGISDDTLRKYYRKELDEGLQDINLDIMNMVYKKIKEDGDINAGFRWLKMRAGWVEAQPPKDSTTESDINVLLDMIRERREQNEKS